MIQKGAPLGHQLSWSHYRVLIPLKDTVKINYYIEQTIKKHYQKEN